MPQPVVAIVGRPNVGKSTLFNRLVGERQAIVENEPGTTRDRIYGQSDWNGVTFTVVDTGGIQRLTAAESQATPGQELTDRVRRQAEVAIRESDAILFVVDAREGLTSADEVIAELVRRTGKPVVLAANKAESEGRRATSTEFYSLGFGDPIAISAYHGSSVGDLLDQLVEVLPAGPEEEEEDERVKIAIVGRPNVGKSALLNAFLGEERSIVSAIPGTTRDAIDTDIDWQGQPVTLIDTAGIRRRGRVETGIEQYSVVRTLRAIDRADVALLVIDAAEGLTAQDTHIAGFIQDARKGMVVVMNKWDLVPKDSSTMKEYTERVQKALDWTADPPLVFVSALTGQRVQNIPEMALRIAAERARRVPTAQLNKTLRAAFEAHPPSSRGRRIKFYYATQPATAPPVFVLYITEPAGLHFSYRRYLENTIRNEYGFAGVPLRLSFRESGGTAE